MQNKQIKEMIDRIYKQIHYDYFGCDLPILIPNEEYEFDTIEEDLEAFLYLFKKFVDEGLILVYIPYRGSEPQKEIGAQKFWDVSSEIMISYIRSVLPKNLNHIFNNPDGDQDEYYEFWYRRFPSVCWIDPDEINNKFGYINTKGEFVIEAKFDFAYDFKNGLARVKQDNKYGFINTKGEFVIEPKFDLAYDFSEGLAATRQDDKFGYINANAQYIIEPKFDFAYDFKDGLARAKKSGKFGFINTKGEEVIECKYNEIDHFKEGLAAVKIDGKYGFINTKGEEIIKCKFESVYHFSNGLAKIIDKNGKEGFINTQGKEVIECKFKSVDDFSEGLAVVEKIINMDL